MSLNAADALLYTLALIGHVALLNTLNNHFHALGIPRPIIAAQTLASRSTMLFAPGVLAWLARDADWTLLRRGAWHDYPWGLLFYVGFCALIALTFVPRWLGRALLGRPPAALKSLGSQRHDLRAASVVDSAQTAVGRLLTRLPLNESLLLDVSEKELTLARLPAALDGLSIAHLSDLHLTGHVPQAYFRRVVELTNELDADLVLLSGDLIEKPACWSWIDDTFARLRARHGVYFVLGNHDIRIDAHETRRRLIAAGLIDLGGRWLTLSLDEQELWLAGNELPWIAPVADGGERPARSTDPLRVLLAHSPDQLGWARRHGFDLMLAGHTHGGQIRFPVVGPVVCPSRHGVRYAAGVFHEPPTLMHVSRGVSGETPLRWNCLPEVTRLVLRCAEGTSRRASESACVETAL